MWVSSPSACLVSCCPSTYCVSAKTFTKRGKREKMMPRSTSKSTAVTRQKPSSRHRPDLKTKARMFREKENVCHLYYDVRIHIHSCTQLFLRGSVNWLCCLGNGYIIIANSRWQQKRKTWKKKWNLWNIVCSTIDFSIFPRFLTLLIVFYVRRKKKTFAHSCFATQKQ